MILEIALNKPNVEKGSVGIIGESPSKTARSPKVWNYVYKELGWNKTFHAFDLIPASLEKFTEYARENLEGFSVAVPYKEKIIPHLDLMDERAQFIGAVNFVRNENESLKGYNTDGEGALKAMYYGSEPFIDTLKGKRVALIGAGGAAKAIAAYVAGEKPSRMDVYNRTHENGLELSDKIQSLEVTSEYFNQFNSREYDLLINASSIGQAGWLKNSDNSYVTLELLSALGQGFVYGVNDKHMDEFIKKNLSLIENNLENSFNFLTLSKTTHFFDAVHTPQETVMLQHARWFGRKTMNGKLMNVLQAVEGFVKVYPEVSYEKVLELMKRA